MDDHFPRIVMEEHDYFIIECPDCGWTDTTDNMGDAFTIRDNHRTGT